MKITCLKIGFIAMAIMLVSACKDDDKPAAKQADLNEQAATQNVHSTISMASALMSQNDGQAAAQSMMSLGLQSESLLIVDPGGAGEGDYIAPNMVVVRQAMTEPGIGALTGTCECDEAAMSCSFRDCGDAEGTITINGSLSWGNGKLACDLRMAGAMDDFGGATTYDITMKMDLTVTETSLDGSIDTTMSSDMDMDGTKISLDMESNITFNAITWDETTLALTGGSLDVSADMSASGGGESARYAGSGTVSFP